MDTPEHAAGPALGHQCHVVITRQVRPGREAEFEAKIATFFARAQAEVATRAYLIRPADRASSQEYGVLRSFEDRASKQAFYDSALYQEWREEVAPLVEGDPDKRELHGLEAFFRPDRPQGGPPTWKMAVLTWVAVNPAVYLSANTFAGLFGKQPMLIELLVVNALVVSLLTWAFMPVLTRLFSRWLSGSRSEAQ